MASRTLPLATLNALSRDDFAASYLDFLKDHFTQDQRVSFETAHTICQIDFNACFDLLSETSSAAYKASTRQWSPSSKKAEMKEPAMKYILVHEALPEAKDAALLGFLSFQLTVEDGLEVSYCYEIHLQEQARGLGLGKKLMSAMERVGQATGMEKAMLTVFTSNDDAKRFYQYLGYEYYDEEPMPPRRLLRKGMTEGPRPTYIILAKSLR